MEGIVYAVPPTILDLVQRGLIERKFYDGMFPALLFRAEAQQEEWQGNIGTELFSSRGGALAPITKPTAPGIDPTPQTLVFEQWKTTILRYTGTMDVNMPTSAVASSDLFQESIQKLGLQAGQSMNRIPRNALCTAYLQGQTTLLAAYTSGDLVAQVSSLSGFTEVLVKGVNTRPVPVSTTNPKAVTIGGIATTVTGAVPLDPNVPLGPGILTISASLGSSVTARASVLAADRPLIMRAGGGTSVDALTLIDILQVQDIINAVNKLRRNNVMPHEDGTYHAHITPEANAQLFTDPAWQRQLNQGVNNNPQYQQAFVGSFAGITFFLDNETPDDTNSGALIATGSNAKFAEDIAAEVVNEGNVRVGRVVITGRAALFERWLDEKRFVSEAGVTGKMATFNVTNQGIVVQTEHVDLILRAPVNRLQDQVACTWSYSGGFPVPSDITSGGPQLYKRAIMIEHALDAG